VRARRCVPADRDDLSGSPRSQRIIHWQPRSGVPGSALRCPRSLLQSRWRIRLEAGAGVSVAPLPCSRIPPRLRSGFPPRFKRIRGPTTQVITRGMCGCAERDHGESRVACAARRHHDCGRPFVGRLIDVRQTFGPTIGATTVTVEVGKQWRWGCCPRPDGLRVPVEWLRVAEEVNVIAR
jgi:hypothetical protein